MKFWFTTAAVLVLGAAGLAQTAAPVLNGGQSQVQQEFRASVEKLRPALLAVIALGNRGPVPVGTGFFVDARGTFLTAAHVLDRQPGISGFRAYIPDTGSDHLLAFDILSLDPTRDFALCRLTSPTKGEPAPHFDFLTLEKNDPPAPGVMVAIAGFPLGGPKPVFQFGTVAAFADAGELLQIGLMLNDGDSGGPVIEVGSGKLVGMAISIRTTALYEQSHPTIGQQNTGLSWVLPVNVVTSVLPAPMPSE